MLMVVKDYLSHPGFQFESYYTEFLSTMRNIELEEVEEEEKAEQERISAAEAQRLQATVDVMVARIAQLTGGKS